LRLGQIGIGCLYCRSISAGASLIESSHLVCTNTPLAFAAHSILFSFCQRTNSKDPRKFSSRSAGHPQQPTKYLAHLSSTIRFHSYFPTCISGIYNATMIIQQRHFPVCPSVSREDLCKYTKLKGLTARSASTKEYWISAAKKKGLVDSSSGELRSSLLLRAYLSLPLSYFRLYSALPLTIPFEYD
jgi:hypothetical protein